ncbi:MAG: multicopper oxidase domain-containing protein [Chloroflexi bacterium]|nr:multicopper oxidase domain-containing protein [Chloroflexota bacterium]
MRQDSRVKINRRDLIKLGGGLLGATVASALTSRALLKPSEVVQADTPVRRARAAQGLASKGAAGADPVGQVGDADLHFVATDGWIYLDPLATVPPYHPDNMAPDPFTTYIFGFRNVTPVSNDSAKVFAQKMKAQLAAPLFWFEEGGEYRLKVTNLGLQIRPDLIDAHTLHFHGFRNAIPIFDGEPHSSVGVPIARDLIYLYRPHDPGTYMYHCHFEETEHVHMGMVGPCFIAPAQNEGAPGLLMARLKGNPDPGAPLGYAYNDGDGSTAYDREFIVFLSEIWTVSHWSDSHVQLPEWSEYAPEFYLLNGRVWPDTLLPDGLGTEPATGDLIPPPGHPELQYQPMSAVIQASPGERVLLRFINLGYEQQAMRLEGITMKVVGKDATLLRGRNGADLFFDTNTVAIGPGESVDAIFVAPPYVGGLPYDRYLLYNRSYQRLTNGGHPGYGGQMTEVRVYPSDALPPQTEPNTRVEPV